jgi:hypothetical protein
MIYLASPYTHPDPFVREHRYLYTAKAVMYLLERKKWVYSPIVHCHELAKIGGLPVDAEFWREYDFAMISHCTSFIILRIEGWEHSKGVAAEKAEAERLHRPISYM